MICPRCQSDISGSNKSKQYNQATNRQCIQCPKCGSKFIVDYAPYAAISAGAGSIAVVMAVSGLTTIMKIWWGAAIIFVACLSMFIASKKIKLIPFSESSFENLSCEGCGKIIKLEQAKKALGIGRNYFFCETCAKKNSRQRLWILGFMIILVLIVVIQVIHGR